MVFNFVRTLLYQRLELFGIRLEFKLVRTIYLNQRLLRTVNEPVKGELVVNKYIIMCAVFESPISGDWIGLVIVFGTTKPEMYNYLWSRFSQTSTCSVIQQGSVGDQGTSFPPTPGANINRAT
jgi:hypothetical protein